MRLPLSTGASAFSYTIGVWLIGAVAGLPLLFATKLPEWVVYPLGFLAAGWVFGVLFLPFQLRKLRASDLVFGEREIEVLGGPAGGKRIPIERAAFRLTFDGKPEDVVRVAHLMHAGEELAESDDPTEIASLEALVALTSPTSLVAGDDRVSGPDDDRASDDIVSADARVGLRATAAEGERGAADVTPEEAGWEPCVACGRPLAPSREGSTRCGACGASNEVPAKVRAGVEAETALAETRVRSDAAVQGLLDQPRPWRVNVALTVAAIPVVVTWPVLGAFFDEFYQCRGLFHWTLGFPVFLGGLGLSVGGLMFVRAQIEGRIAHRVLVTEFRASRPAVAGAPWTCGRCGGPLPDVGRDRVVVRCVYCGTDQILGIDLPGRVAPAREHALDLEGELGLHTHRRRRFRWLGVGAVGLAVLGALVLRDPLRLAADTPSRNTRCGTH